MPESNVQLLRPLHRNPEGQLLDLENVLVSEYQTLGAPVMIEVLASVGNFAPKVHDADIAAIAYVSRTPEVGSADAYELGKVQSGRWGAMVPVQYYNIKNSH